jgi:hypothetical protein
MKKQFIFLLLLILFSCKESVVRFSEAQPEYSKNLIAFPGKLIGTYYDLENDVELEIQRDLILKKIILKDTFNIKKLEKDEILRNDSIINTKTLEKFSITKINDTLLTNLIYVDTIFKISSSYVLKKTKGHYFLNSKDNDNNWSVKKLTLKNGQLSLNNISSVEEIDLLEEIIGTKKDSTRPFIVKPTKKQFKEFVSKNGFSEGEIYLKK